MSGNHNSGRKPKYLTIEKFEQFLKNDMKHLKNEVTENKWLMRVFLVALIVWALTDRLLG